MNTEKTEEFLKSLGLKWRDISIYNQALTHTSFANENRHLRIHHNQRLEFLGDAVLELVVSDYLYRHFRDFPEGLLTKTRAAVVCEPSLARVATGIRLGEYLRIGKGEDRSGGRTRPSLLADAMEALIGAVYIDLGLQEASKFIHHLLAPFLDEVAQKGGKIGDYKTELQELVQQKSDIPLHYTIVKEEGPDHDKTFTSAVSYNGEIWGTGTGKSKKEAEQDAAHQALDKLKKGSILI